MTLGYFLEIKIAVGYNRCIRYCVGETKPFKHAMSIQSRDLLIYFALFLLCRQGNSRTLQIIFCAAKVWETHTITVR
jgi:hypothetical protein